MLQPPTIRLRMQSSWTISGIELEQIVALAPLDLINHRSLRYGGDTLCCKLSDFDEPDQERIRGLYEFLLQIFAFVREPVSVAAAKEFATFLASLDLDKMVRQAVAIGQDSPVCREQGRVAQVAHDLRGGGLTSLIGHLQIGQLQPEQIGSTHTIFLLTRDHLKIMRNALLGLDDAERDADLLPKTHVTDLLIEKWDGAEFKASDRAVQVSVDHKYRGPIAESCVEFGAIDRILYNLMNNAARHSSSDTVQLFLLPLPQADGAENLRLAVVNAVSTEDANYLHEISVRGDLPSLFEAGVSTTGSGLGLAIAADFVFNAFGLGSAKEAVQGRYIGARLVGDQFVVWFHWPIAAVM